jgi:peptidoglycan/LPS O-acetylase OafA/YrhL
MKPADVSGMRALPREWRSTVRPMNPASPPRTAGLDTLRALAISLVCLYHYTLFVSPTPRFGWVSDVGWVGVDLFFVLSGYLIGNQLFAGVARGERLSLKAFYARRALRTWPAFWFVLAAYFLFPSVMGGKTPPPLWAFLSFTQNLGLQPGTAFSHAWSLCIEEQFYLVLPAALLLALRFGSGRLQAWLALGALVLLGVAARSYLWSLHGRPDDQGLTHGYYPHIYYASLCRFDEFVPGVAVALLKNFHPAQWQRAMRHGNALLAAGLVASGALVAALLRFYYVDGQGYGFFTTAAGYSLLAMAFALLVMAALSPASWLHRVRVPGAGTLALWSYSIYLSHRAVGHVLQGVARQEAWPAALTVVAVLLASLVVGAVLYRFVERPFMLLRDRRFPSAFRPRLPAWCPPADTARP